MAADADRRERGVTGHSKLGASKAHRWFECPGSVALCATVVAPPASVHAARGTMAHDVAAKCLDRGEDAELWVGNRFEIDEHRMRFEQDDAAAVQVYLDAIRADATAGPSDAPVRMIEQKFHLKDLHYSLYGTADCVQWFKRTKLLRVYDYKHGAGVAVDVKDNPQLLYYALGALLETGAPVKEVEIVVVQPRCPHPDGPVRRQRIPAIDLLEFRADLLDAVARTEDPNAPRNAGEWCMFCEVQAVCPEAKTTRQIFAAANRPSAKDEFTPVSGYADVLACPHCSAKYIRDCQCHRWADELIGLGKD